jgi:hypothetical protein
LKLRYLHEGVSEGRLTETVEGDANGDENKKTEVVFVKVVEHGYSDVGECCCEEAS